MSAVPNYTFSCSTNLSKEVLDALRAAKLGSRAWDICALMHNETFGDAGWHRDAGDPEAGLWCQFDLAQWSHSAACDRSNMRRIIGELVACHIIYFHPDGCGGGRIGWNVSFAEWLPYDRRRAQRVPAEQPGMVISAETTTPDRSKITMLARSKQPRQAAPDAVKITTPASHKAAADAAPLSALRMIGSQESREETPPRVVTTPRARTSTQGAPEGGGQAATHAQHAAIVAKLRRAADWKPSDKRDFAAVQELADTYNLHPRWILDQAIQYGLSDKGPHTPPGFIRWCTNPIAQKKYQDWYGEQLLHAQQRQQAADAEQRERDRRAGKPVRTAWDAQAQREMLNLIKTQKGGQR